MLAPLTGYNDFAQGYACRTEPDRLAWCRVLGKTLDDGRPVRLHGLNSALVSDAADAPGKLLVSEFQTSHFERTPGVVDVTLCHHPPEWLLDKGPLRDALRAFAPVALFGHEHSARIVGDVKQVQLFAGAVQPSRRDPDWLPTYHILQLIVQGAEAHPELIVRIHTREFDARLQVPPETQRGRRASGCTSDQDPDMDAPSHRAYNSLSGWPRFEPCSTPAKDGPFPESPMPTPRDTAQRELLVHFFRLRTPDRYAAANDAGLLRDGDDGQPPDDVGGGFSPCDGRADGPARFWTAVASRTPMLKDTPNPFVP